MATHLIIPDLHAVPGTDHSRADHIGKLILDLKPDVVVNGGDMFDMGSLSSYDKGKASFYNKNYRADINAGLEVDDRLWSPIRKAKKKKPLSIFLEGNHEQRVRRVLEYQFELEGAIGFHDYDLNRNYDIVAEYQGATPSIVSIDGINYAHYFVSGVKGHPVSGMNPARMLLSKMHESSTSFHTHTLDFAIDTTGSGRKIIGLFAGVGHEREPPYAGITARLWWSGVIIKEDVDNGFYNPRFITLERLKKEYG